MKVHQFQPSLPPPENTTGVVGWFKKNLFNSPANSIVTVILAYFAFMGLWNVLDWAFINADWVKRTWIWLFFVNIYPFLIAGLLYGGVFGLEVVETHKWGGLLVTLIIALVGIVVSLPIGVVLALGRRSNMPIIRSL